MKIFTVKRKWGDSNYKMYKVAANTMEKAVEDVRRHMKKLSLSGEIMSVEEEYEVDIAYKH